MKFIDDDREHNMILAALGILDDLEDWDLFQLMMHECILDDDIDTETYLKYVVPPKAKKQVFIRPSPDSQSGGSLGKYSREIR